MDEAVVRIPVTCPTCGTEHLVEVHEFVLKVALDRWNNMRLHADCHDVSWDASEAELERIRAYIRDNSAEPGP
jgi:hypothetical protein